MGRSLHARRKPISALLVLENTVPQNKYYKYDKYQNHALDEILANFLELDPTLLLHEAHKR